MKLEELVKEDEKNKLAEKEINQLRENAIIKVKELKEIGIQVSNLQKPKMEEMQVKCMEEAESFFRNGKFDIERSDKVIIARYNNIEIELKNDSEDEMVIFPIKIKPRGVYSSIEIRPKGSQQSMFYQKNNLKIGELDFDFKNYVELINKCNDRENLVSLIKKAEENIIHYQNTIKNFNDIVYVYSIYDTHIECSSFEEVFENHVS